ncbi:MAG: glycerophosphodiester phosphodiesterase [Hyphomicrobium sp.]|nr:glycerophosphodiester phosphodiesterase [Hyphomicrobium sp.]
MTKLLGHSHLLSHRLRGFDERESTAIGVARALAKRIAHVEFDVRATRDGKLVAFHDPFFEDDSSQWQFIDSLTLTELQKQKSLSHLATLDEVCRVFAAEAAENTLLHVDVKVSGYERQILAVLEEHGVLTKSVIVSWLPSVLQAFNMLSPETPLCFSHITLVRAPWLLPFGKIFAAPIVLRSLGQLFSPFNTKLSLEFLTTRLHFHSDGNPSFVETGQDRTRCNHGHIVPRALTGPIFALLQRTKGYVCLPVASATKSLVADYHSNGIKVAVFSANSAAAADSIMTTIAPDIIYMDVATVFE